MELKPGKMTALIGPNGCGKTSCVNLLKRLYEPQEGQILLDGEPLHHYKHEYLHQKVQVTVKFIYVATFCVRHHKVPHEKTKLIHKNKDNKRIINKIERKTLKTNPHHPYLLVGHSGTSVTLMSCSRCIKQIKITRSQVGKLFLSRFAISGMFYCHDIFYLAKINFTSVKKLMAKWLHRCWR